MLLVSSSLQKFAFAITDDDYTGIEDGWTYVKPNSFIKLSVRRNSKTKCW